MRHSGNYAQSISDRYELGSVKLKLYVYDELDRFFTVADFKLSERDLTYLLDGILEERKRHAEREQPTLPPWS